MIDLDVDWHMVARGESFPLDPGLGYSEVQRAKPLRVADGGTSVLPMDHPLAWVSPAHLGWP